MRIIKKADGLRAEKEHSFKLRGEEISYRVITEETFLGEEEAEASIVSFTYLRTGVESENRPVVFVFNGGPGSSCVWMHLGLFGPRRIQLENPVDPAPVPPYVLEDNPHCMLDVCDLVLIDPVETGFARLYDKEKGSSYFGADCDAQAVSLFIENWLNRYERMNSPKFLAGESYGTIRSCQLLKALMGACLTKEARLVAIPINGVIFLGSAIACEKQHPQFPDILFTFSAMAASNWYHNREGKPAKVSDFVEEAEGFAAKEYLKLLYLGERLPETEREETLQKAGWYLGLSPELLKRKNYEIEIDAFAEELLRDRGLDLGLYDARFVLPHNDHKTFHDTITDDGAMGKYTPAFAGGMGLYRKELGISRDREYRAIDLAVNEDFPMSGEMTNVDCLIGAMRRNSRLGLFFGTGVYDLVTTAGLVRYVVNHMGIDHSRVTVKEYESGHMPYLGEESCEKLEADMREFIAKYR